MTFDVAVTLRLPEAVSVPPWTSTLAPEVDETRPSFTSPLNRPADWLFTLIVNCAARVML